MRLDPNIFFAISNYLLSIFLSEDHIVDDMIFQDFSHSVKEPQKMKSMDLKAFKRDIFVVVVDDAALVDIWRQSSVELCVWSGSSCSATNEVAALNE